MATHEYITLQGILDRLGGAKQRRGDEYICTCPAHSDHKPSLWVSEGQKGIIMKCRANKCSTADICAAIGIEVSALFRDPPSGGGKPRAAKTSPAAPAPQPDRPARPAKTYESYEAAYSHIGKLVKVYPYTGVDGKLLFEVARIRLADGDKTFRQHRPVNPALGKFPIVLSVPAEIRQGVLYRMPEIDAAVRAGREVYVVEGEKDADTLAGMGYAATTCPGGAKSWTSAHSEHLKGADVIIVPDNDEPGEGHAKQVASLTVRLAARVRIARLVDEYPHLPHKGDITDLVELVGADRAKEILQRAADKAPRQTVDLYEIALQTYEKIPGYCVAGGCICQNTENGPKTLGTFVALPTREVTVDDGVQVTKRLEIAGWSARGRALETLYIDMDKFSGMSWAANHWGLTANIMPGTTVKDKLRAVIMTAGAQVATQRTIYAHTGWRRIGDKWAYLYEGGCVGADDVEVSMDKGLSMYGLGGLPEGLSQMEAVFSSSNLIDLIDTRISVPMMGLMYLAPLREFLEQAGVPPTFTAMLKGGTGTHKSSLAALFMSHFGDFRYDRVPANFHDTTNALRRKAFLLKDMPLLVDDYHPSSGMQERRKMEATAQNLLRAFGDNADRGRLTSELTLQASMPPRSLALITGEELPDVGESGINRLYMMEVEKDDVEITDELTTSQRVARAGDLRQAMRGYIEWLLPKADGMAGVLEELFYSYRDKARTIIAGSGTHDRAAPAVAHIMIGLTMMLDYFEDVGLVDHDGRDSKLEEYWQVVAANSKRQAEANQEERPVQMYMQAVSEMIISKAVTVVDITPGAEIKEPGKDNVGYVDQQNYYFHAGTLYGAVVQFYSDQARVFSANQTEIQRMLRDEGIVTDTGGEKVVTKLKRVGIGKNPIRLLWIPRWRIDGTARPTEQMDFQEVSKNELPKEMQ